MRNFRNYDVWNAGVDFSAHVYELTEKFPRKELYALCDQFLFVRNYAKNVDGLFARIIGKISAFTVLQYINKTNNKPIGQIKYALL